MSVSALMYVIRLLRSYFTTLMVLNWFPAPTTGLSHVSTTSSSASGSFALTRSLSRSLSTAA